MRVCNVVKAEAAFDTQALFIGWAIDTINPGDLLIADLETDLTSDAAIRANGLNFTIKSLAVTDFLFIDCGSRHQGTRWASLYTFATGYTGAGTHGVRHIESDTSIMTST